MQTLAQLPSYTHQKTFVNRVDILISRQELHRPFDPVESQQLKILYQLIGFGFVQVTRSVERLCIRLAGIQIIRIQAGIVGQTIVERLECFMGLLAEATTPHLIGALGHDGSGWRTSLNTTGVGNSLAQLTNTIDYCVI